MKVTVPTQDVDISGAVKQQLMRVKQDEVMFEALSSTIYTNTRWILEYAQNARDVDQNWKLSLPTIVNPWMEFIDNGPSMSEDFMLSRGEYQDSGFCTVFSSTKRNSDTQVGGFGIGRLSGPQGTIFICRNWDAIRTYILMKNERSIPMIVLQSTAPRPNDTPVGTTVRVPVAPKDIASTVTMARNQLKFFNVSGIDSPEYLIEGSNWKIASTQLNSSSTAIVGGYPIAIDPYEVWKNIPSELNDKYSRYSYHTQRGRSNAWGLASNPKLVFELGISDVDMALNRESLRYTEKTVRAILAELDKISDEVAGTIEDSMKSSPSLWHARCVLNEALGYNSGFAGCLENRTFHCHGVILNTEDAQRIRVPTGFSVRSDGRSRRRSQPIRIQPKDVTHVYVHPEAKFYVNDVKRGIAERFATVVNSASNNSNVYLIGPDDLDPVLKLLGNPPYEKLSSVAYAGSQRSTSSTKGTLPPQMHLLRSVKLHIYDGNGRSYDEFKVEAFRADTQAYTNPSRDMCYAYTERNTPIDPRVNELMSLSIAPVHVACIPKSKRKAIPHHWVELTEYMHDKCPLPQTLTDIQFRANMREWWFNQDASCRDLFDEVTKLYCVELGLLRAKIVQANEATEEERMWLKAAKILDIQFDEPQPITSDKRHQVFTAFEKCHKALKGLAVAVHRNYSDLSEDDEKEIIHLAYRLYKEATNV